MIKHIIIFTLTFLSLNSFSQKVNTTDLTLKDDLIVWKKDSTLFSGICSGLMQKRAYQGKFAKIIKLSGVNIDNEIDIFEELHIEGCVFNGLEVGYWQYRYVEEWIFYNNKLGYNICNDSLEIVGKIDTIDFYYNHRKNQIKAIQYFNKGYSMELILFNRSGEIISNDCTPY